MTPDEIKWLSHTELTHLANGVLEMTEALPIPTEGRIVHVRVPGVAHCQPAIVVRNWGGTNPVASLNLQVFRDGSNDSEHHNYYSGDRFAATRWATSVAHESLSSGTGQSWHWPERVGQS